jgi:DNA-damage-inducible protein J
MSDKSFFRHQFSAEPVIQMNYAAAHDAWFRVKVLEALNDPRPDVPHEEVEAHFAKRRAAGS